MSPNFKHINADQQIINGSITTPLFAPGAVTVQAMNINGDLDFHNHQALSLRTENVTTTPAPGNIGRIVYNTTTSQFLIDNGTAFVPVSSTSGVASLNGLSGALTLAAGSNITITPSGGNTLTIASTGGSTSPGGSDTQVQYNSSGSFAGSSNLTFDGTNLTVAGDITVGHTETSASLNFTVVGGYDINARSTDGTMRFSASGIELLKLDGNFSIVHIEAPADLGGNLIHNVADPVVAQDAATKNYVDTHSGGSANYQQDLFHGTQPSNTVTLTHTPIANSQLVFWNGIALAQGSGEDYTLTGTTLTLNGSITLSSGDKILVVYPY